MQYPLNTFKYLICINHFANFFSVYFYSWQEKAEMLKRKGMREGAIPVAKRGEAFEGGTYLVRTTCISRVSMNTTRCS